MCWERQLPRPQSTLGQGRAASGKHIVRDVRRRVRHTRRGLAPWQAATRGRICGQAAQYRAPRTAAPAIATRAQFSRSARDFGAACACTRSALLHGATPRSLTKRANSRMADGICHSLRAMGVGAVVLSVLRNHPLGGAVSLTARIADLNGGLSMLRLPLWHS